MENIKTGYGSMSKENGFQYVGEIVDGIPHGIGTLTQPTGRKYVGEIVDGLPHGKGIETNPNGIYYEGCFEYGSVSYTHLRAHETDSYLVCRLLLEKKFF